MKHFNPAPGTLQELRSMFRDLAFKFHPDLTGEHNTETMKEINLEYESLSNRLADGTQFADSEKEFSTLYKEKIEVLIKLQGLFIEIIGNWLWVSGNTKEHKDKLKELKFNYAPKKQAWFFKNYPYRKKGKEKELDEIRQMYGSQVVSKQSSDIPKSNLLFS